MTFSSAAVHGLKFCTFPAVDCDSTNGKHCIFFKVVLRGNCKSPPNPWFHKYFGFFFFYTGLSVILCCYLNFFCEYTGIKRKKIICMCRKVKDKSLLSHKTYFPWSKIYLLFFSIPVFLFLQFLFNFFFFLFFLQFFSPIVLQFPVPS